MIAYAVFYFVKLHHTFQICLTTSEFGRSLIKSSGSCHFKFLSCTKLGPFVMRSTCRYCQGTKMYIKFPCSECEGKGSTVQRKKVTVPVPAGEKCVVHIVYSSLVTIIYTYSTLPTSFLNINLPQDLEPQNSIFVFSLFCAGNEDPSLLSETFFMIICV